MPVLDNLSVAANVFQIVSFTDNVFRAGQALYELFNKARAASKNIAQLLLTLHALLSVIAHVRVFITEHASSPFAQEDGQALPHLRTILTLIEQDFRHIRGLLVETMGVGNEGRWSFLLVPLRWVFNEPEIEDARQRLAQYTSHLSAALEVSGRRNDIILRTKLQSIEDKLCSISPHPHVEPPPAYSARPHLRIPRKQTKVIFPSIQANHPNKAPIRYPSENGKSKATAASSPNPSPPLYPDGGCPKIWIHEQPDSTYFFETGDVDLRSIIKPILLLQDYLITALDATRTGQVLRITSAQAEQFRLLFDLLMASAHSACADALLQQYSQVLGPFEKRQTVHSEKEDAYRPSESNPLPMLVDEEGFSLDTTIGTIRANILISRWDREEKTLAFTFQYFGSRKSGLSPFVVEYRSQDIRSIANLCLIDSSRWKTFTRGDITDLGYDGAKIPEKENSRLSLSI